jgi:hypothetical protein
MSLVPKKTIREFMQAKKERHLRPAFTTILKMKVGDHLTRDGVKWALRNRVKQIIKFRCFHIGTSCDEPIREAIAEFEDVYDELDKEVAIGWIINLEGKTDQALADAGITQEMIDERQEEFLIASRTRTAHRQPRKPSILHAARI